LYKKEAERLEYTLRRDNFSVCSDNEFTSKIDIAHKEVLEENWFSFELMSIEQYKTALSTNNKEAELIFYQ
ncbi:MAG: hypothetical protein ACPHLK_01550, partial [Gammaproteobacteria bacterium]